MVQWSSCSRLESVTLQLGVHLNHLGVDESAQSKHLSMEQCFAWVLSGNGRHHVKFPLPACQHPVISIVQHCGSWVVLVVIMILRIRVRFQKEVVMWYPLRFPQSSWKLVIEAKKEFRVRNLVCKSLSTSTYVL